jgi:hypothetical protein
MSRLNIGCFRENLTPTIASARLKVDVYYVHESSAEAPH